MVVYNGTPPELPPPSDMRRTKKRFRLGHYVGLLSFLLFFMHDQSRLSREILVKSTPSCQQNTSSNYIEFIDEGAIAPNYVGGTFNPNQPNQVIHFAEFGLGHRLSKISSAWHLTKALNLTRMVLFWGDCQGDPTNLARQLFGSDSIDVPGTEHIAMRAKENGNVGKTIKVKNDVTGYYNAKNYKQHKVLLPKSIASESSPWMEKYRSDVELYRILLKRFVGKKNVIKFMEEKNFKDRFVVGIHLRLGNGETQHFVQAGRVVNNEKEFINNFLDLLKLFVDNLQMSHPQRFDADKCSQTTKRKMPLFFLATDTPKYIKHIQDYTKQLGIDTVLHQQVRIETGVTFTVKNGWQCAQGWYDMLFDDIILSFSDVLVAARYSTFTQSMPMPLIFDRASGIRGPHFCEVADSGRVMTCLEDMRTWIFRDNPSKTFTYSTEYDDTAAASEEVIHRMTVNFPDVELPDQFLDAVHFLKSSPNLQSANRNRWHGQVTKTQTMDYGGDSLLSIDNKYRKPIVCPFCTHFTFE